MLLFRHFPAVVASCICFFSLASCRKSSRAVDEDEDKIQVCQNILKQTETETFPLVQPPALSRFGMENVDLSVLPLPADSHVAVGINLCAFVRSGLLAQITRLFPDVAMAPNVLTFLGLTPGRGAQALLVGARFGKHSWMPENVTIAILGSFSAQDTLNRILGIASLKTWLPQIEIPQLERDGDAVTIAFHGIRIWMIPHGANAILVTNQRNTRTDLASNAEFTRMMAPIPRDTALWFGAVQMPPELPPMAKVIERLLSQLKRFSGYLNMDDKLNVEFQLRSQFAHHQAALQAKEILRLGVSQILMQLGPRIQKSFSLDGSSDHENVVSRGSFVRMLFRLDRFQVQYLLQWTVSTLRETGYWIYDRKSGTNASSGTAANP